MCTCRPSSSRPSSPATRSISAGAWPSGTPNFASALPVSTAACVSPGTAGLTRIRTRWPLAPRRTSRSTSSALSITIRPTPAASASPMSRSLLALPCSRRCSGSNPADRAIASSPAEATSQPSPSLARTRRTGAQGSAFEAKCTSVAGWRARNASRYSRARSRRPCSSKTRAGVPNSAAMSARAHPPTRRRPSAPCPAVDGRTPRRPEPALVVMAGQYRPGHATAQSPPPARPAAR